MSGASISRRLVSCAAKLALLLPLSLWVTTGCVTKGDLEALKQEIQTSTAKVETLKGETKTGIEATRKQVEEQQRQLAQDLKALQEAFAKLAEAVKAEQAKLTDQAAKQDSLAKDQVEVRSAVRASNRILYEFLKAEEARLKASLALVQTMLKEAVADEEKPKEPKPK